MKPTYLLLPIFVAQNFLITSAGQSSAVEELAESIPAEQRTYRFQFEEIEYRDLLIDFAEQAGLDFVGDAPKGLLARPVPKGKTAFDCGTEEINYQLAFNRLNMVLRPTETQLVRNNDKLETLVTFSLIEQYGGIIYGYYLLAQSGLPDSTLVRVILDNPSDDCIDVNFEPFFRMKPDYLRVSNHDDTNALLLTGTLLDLRIYTPMWQMLVCPRTYSYEVRIYNAQDECKDAIAALEDTLKEVRVWKSDPHELEPYMCPCPSDELVHVWADEPRGRVVIRCVPEMLPKISELMTVFTSDDGT